MNLLLGHVGVVLGRNDNRFHAGGLAVLILHRYLRFSVGAQIWQGTVFSYRRQTLGQRVGKVNRQRHQCSRFVAGKAEHNALIPRADQIVFIRGAAAGLKRLVHAHRNIGRLHID